MNKTLFGKITEEQLLSIIQTYHNLVFSYSDHQYLTNHETNLTRLAFLDQNHIFFHRLKYYILVVTLIEVNKLLSDKETYSLNKYVKYELSNGSDDSLAIELNRLLVSLESKELIDVKERIFNLRNKAAVHLTPNRRDYKGTNPLITEIELILKIILNFIKLFHQILYSSEYVNPITKDVLGYKLYEQFKVYFETKANSQ